MSVITENLNKHVLFEDQGEGQGITLWHQNIKGENDKYLDLTEEATHKLALRLLQRDKKLMKDLADAIANQVANNVPWDEVWPVRRVF